MKETNVVAKRGPMEGCVEKWPSAWLVELDGSSALRMRQGTRFVKPPPTKYLNRPLSHWSNAVLIETHE